MILFLDCAWQIYIGTVCEILGEKLVKCTQGLAKLPVFPNQKSFWKKYHAPSLAIWGQVQLRGITQSHTELFSQNVVTTFGYLKSSLFSCRWSQTQPKSGIYSSIKAVHCCKKSSSSYQLNSLKFEFKNISVISPWDHLKIFSLAWRVYHWILRKSHSNAFRGSTPLLLLLEENCCTQQF